MRSDRYINSLAAVAVVFTALMSTACGDDAVCGPGDAPSDGVTLSIPGTDVSVGSFTSSPNNDCTPTQGDTTSLTLDGFQTEIERRFHTTFCIPRPHKMPSGPVQLSDTAVIEVIDVSAEVDGCLLVLDRTVQPTGTIEFLGYCDDGLHSGGYAIELSGTVGGLKMCPGGDAGVTSEPVTIALTGTAAVQAL